MAFGDLYPLGGGGSFQKILYPFILPSGDFISFFPGKLRTPGSAKPVSLRAMFLPTLFTASVAQASCSNAQHMHLHTHMHTDRKHIYTHPCVFVCVRAHTHMRSLLLNHQNYLNRKWLSGQQYHTKNKTHLFLSCSEHKHTQFSILEIFIHVSTCVSVSLCIGISMQGPTESRRRHC